MIDILQPLLYYFQQARVRFLLILLNMAIGVFALTMVLSLSEMGQDLIYDEIESFGVNRVWVYRDHGSLQNEANSDWITSNRVMSNADYQALVRSCSRYLRGAAPSIRYGGWIDYMGRRYENIMTIGTTNDWQKIRDEKVKAGRFLTSMDEHFQKRVAVISEATAQRIFGNKRALGRKINIAGQNISVVGILEQKDRPLLSSFTARPMHEELAFIPLSLMQSAAFYNTKNVFYVDFQINSIEESEKVEKRISDFLQVKFGDTQDFVIKMLYSEIQTSKRIMRTLKLVLTFIALITLAMAGITITNTMLAAVMERFYEIGLRRAIGAKRKDVLSQFLIEAACIGFVGGMAGVLFSVFVYSVSLIWLRYTDIAFFNYSLVSLLVSGITGFMAGIYPAYQASRLNPIEALNRTFH